MVAYNMLTTKILKFIKKNHREPYHKNRLDEEQQLPTKHLGGATQ
jgi:hypothetical protein